jgi:hypothetical protein
MINVPTVTWIDDEGRVARPNDVAFVDDRFMAYSGVSAVPHLEALRAWVRGERPAMTPEEVRALQTMPTADDQRARTEFDLGWWLYQQGHTEAAEGHFAEADRLAPHDFMHRRGTMRLRGRDPFGTEYRDMAQAAREAGIVFARRLPTPA